MPSEMNKIITIDARFARLISKEEYCCRRASGRGHFRLRQSFLISISQLLSQIVEYFSDEVLYFGKSDHGGGVVFDHLDEFAEPLLVAEDSAMGFGKLLFSQAVGPAFPKPHRPHQPGYAETGKIADNLGW